jgi:hypothetical protein
MLRALLGRILPDDAGEPEQVSFEDLPSNDVSALQDRLVVVPCAAPRAFYDAPNVTGHARADRLTLANSSAVLAQLECPPYHAQRGDPTKDLLFISRQPQRTGRDRGWVEGAFRVEVELQGERGVLRDLTADDAPAPGVDLPPERVLELAQVLRQGRFWDLPTTDVEEGRLGWMWYVSRLERGRQHLVLRGRPHGATLQLLESLAAVLDDELAGFAQHHAALAQQRTRCGFAGCAQLAAPGDRSGVCADHRKRIDAQGRGKGLTRRRK